MTTIPLSISGNQSILICIPTCMRPKMLAACLQSVAATELPNGFETQLLVLDNDVNKSAQRAFDVCSFPFPAHYAMEPQRGLTKVRNRALDEAQKGKHSHMAFIDDDQTVDKKWLVVLAEGMLETGADAISGHAKAIFADGKPPWWMDPPADVDPGLTVSNKGHATNILLMNASLFTRLRFDERFNFTGGEDYDFTLRATRLGFVFAQTGQSKAWAMRHQRRLTFRRHFLLQWQWKTGRVLSHRSADGFCKSLLFLPIGGVKVVKGALSCVASIVLGKKYLHSGIKKIVNGTGLMYGVFAHGRYQQYVDIDGE